MAIQGNGVSVLSPYDQLLASLPEKTRKGTGPGIEPGGSNKAVQAEQTASDNGILTSDRTLADADDQTKFRAIEQLVRSQDRLARNRWAIDTHFRRVRSGIPFSRLEKVPNQNIWVAKLPNGMNKESSASFPNKADDLCNKVEDTLMADPPKPAPAPHVDDESAELAAELASEFLTQDGGESGTNDILTYRWALNNAFTASASFLHYVVDKTGGGYQALQKLAHPKATDPANPLVAQIPLPPDPANPTAQQTIEERATDPILRYVSPPSEGFPEGQFVENAEQADRVWLPRIEIEKLRREQVRIFPPTASLTSARALIAIRHCTLSEARSRWHDTVGKMQDAELTALAGWKPAMSDLVLPYAVKGAMQDGATGPSLSEVGSFSPLLQRRMFAYRIYITACPEYPAGYFADVSGVNGGTTLEEGDLEYSVNLPTAGKTKRCRDIPVTEVRPLQDVDGGDPMGWPFISRFAGSAEAAATLYAAFLDVCDNMLHPHVFLRSTASVDEDDWFDRTMPIVLSPSDAEPIYEQFPRLPPILEVIQDLDKRDDTISGLTATAQGLDSSNAISGVAKNLTIRQALVSLSGFQQNLHQAMTRGWRIKCQLAQAEFTTSQMIQFSGEEGSAESRWWTGEDLSGIDRIGIQPGTGTMMTPEGKAQYVAFLQSQQWMQPEQASEVALPGVRMDLGLPEDPFKQAIERSIATWLEGPTEEWLKAAPAHAQAQQAFDANKAQWEQLAAQAQQMGQAPPPEPQAPPSMPGPFPLRVNDSEPKVATVYLAALSKLLVTPRFGTFDSEWQRLASDAYLRAQKALTPPAPPPGVLPPPAAVQHPPQPKAPEVKTIPQSLGSPKPL